MMRPRRKRRGRRIRVIAKNGFFRILFSRILLFFSNRSIEFPEMDRSFPRLKWGEKDTELLSAVGNFIDGRRIKRKKVFAHTFIEGKKDSYFPTFARLTALFR